jgi:hypothetical protein
MPRANNGQSTKYRKIIIKYMKGVSFSEEKNMSLQHFKRDK